MEEVRRQIEVCLDKFRSGSLTEADIQNVLKEIDHRTGTGLKQGLLYVYASSNTVFSPALSISIIEDGVSREGLNARGEFIYRSAYEAMQDGWRVIKFPEMTLAMDDQNTYGLGFEFILERYRGCIT